MTICKNCDKEFISQDTHKNRERKYCSQKCMGESSKKKSTQLCLQCGKPFIPVGKTRIRKFCSYKCSTKYHIGEKASNWNKVKLVCIICGNEYLIKKSQLEHYGTKCCSRKCMGLLQSTQIGEYSKHWKGGKIERVCKICGKEFYRFPSQAQGVRGNICSAKCRGTNSMVIINSYNINTETSIEKIVANVLDELNIIYTSQKNIGSFFADFYIEKYNLIIEADGDYWHNIPNAKEKDDKKTAIYSTMDINY